MKNFISARQSLIRDPAWHSSDSNQNHVYSVSKGSEGIQLVIPRKLFLK